MFEKTSLKSHVHCSKLKRYQFIDFILNAFKNLIVLKLHFIKCGFLSQILVLMTCIAQSKMVLYEVNVKDTEKTQV